MAPVGGETGRRGVLLIRFGAMGDVILASPAARTAAEAAGPVDFAVKAPYLPLLRSNPAVREVLPLGGEDGAFRALVRRVRAARYEAVIDLQNSPRSRLLALLSGAPVRGTVRIGRVKRFLLVRFGWDLYGDALPVPLKFIRAASAAGARDDGRGLDLPVDPDESAALDGRLKTAGLPPDRPLVALAPGAGRATKRWPAERFGAAAAALLKAGYAAAFVGGAGDRTACAAARAAAGGPSADFSGALSLAGTAALIARSRLCVTNDTGIMHMASALRVPCVAVFGPTTRHFGFFPFRSPSAVVERDLDCRPCSYHGTERCPRGHFRCMLDVAPDEVIRAAGRILNTET
jgi:heptosyltransferase II